MEVEYANSRPSVQEVRDQLANLDLGSLTVQPVGEKGMILRMKEISPDTHERVIEKLGSDAKEKQFEVIGPTIGAELRNKTIVITLLGILAILVYIALAFRQAIKPVYAWHYSLASVLASIHDIAVPLGVLAVLGHFYGVQFTIPIVVALLTILGYSINDTVVVFDRVRENLLRKTGVDLVDTVDKSFWQTLGRSLGTSFTTLLVVLAIFFFGGDTLRYFALTLAVGIIAGTLSSIFLASPALLVFAKWKGKDLT